MICSTCKTKKTPEEFYKNASRKTGYSAQCRDCIKAWRVGRVDKTFSYTMLYSHNLDIERYNSILASQGNACRVCKTDRPGTTGRWAIDHDHRCCPGKKSCGSCIRGLLCRDCNIMIGFMEKARFMDFDFESYLDKRV